MLFDYESDNGMVQVNKPTDGAEPHIPFGSPNVSSKRPSQLPVACKLVTKHRSADVRWVPQ
ncbi:MAG: hypothetical protein ACRDPA_05575 [Solirubrobacteraceae bacterium]